MACKQLELQKRSELPWQLVSLTLVETLDAVQGWEARTDVWLEQLSRPLAVTACMFQAAQCPVRGTGCSVPSSEGSRQREQESGAGGKLYRWNHGVSKHLGKQGILGFSWFPNSAWLPEGFQQRVPPRHPPVPAPSRNTIPTPPHPTRPHLRRSSGGGTPRRRFTHC